MKKTAISFILILSFFNTVHADREKNTFAISNISEIPTYEYYEFTATGTTLEKSKVIIEYTLKNSDTDSALWIVKGAMPINGLLIEEEYEITLKDLNVISSKRKQTFTKGSTISDSRYTVDITPNDSLEFVISTFQGLMYILRTFPFEKGPKEISVLMAQQRNDKIAIKVKNKGIKTITTPKYGTINATEIQVSLSIPFVGGFLPNVNYYFMNDKAKTLIAMKGAFSVTGKKMDVLLTKHDIKK